MVRVLQLYCRSTACCLQSKRTIFYPVTLYVERFLTRRKSSPNFSTWLAFATNSLHLHLPAAACTSRRSIRINFFSPSCSSAFSRTTMLLMSSTRSSSVCVATHNYSPCQINAAFTCCNFTRYVHMADVSPHGCTSSMVLLHEE